MELESFIGHTVKVYFRQSVPEPEPSPSGLVSVIHLRAKLTAVSPQWIELTALGGQRFAVPNDFVAYIEEMAEVKEARG